MRYRTGFLPRGVSVSRGSRHIFHFSSRYLTVTMHVTYDCNRQFVPAGRPGQYVRPYVLTLSALTTIHRNIIGDGKG